MMADEKPRVAYNNMPGGISSGDTAVEVVTTYKRTLPTPSVGRVVHYVSHGTPVQSDGGQAFTSQCRAAIITEVAADGQTLLTEADGREHSSDEAVVGLCVLNPTGIFLHRSAFHDGSETQGDPDCPNAGMHGTVHRYCSCGWIEGSYRGGTWHWPERV